jgi:hypothetical protein
MDALSFEDTLLSLLQAKHSPSINGSEEKKIIKFWQSFIVVL